MSVTCITLEISITKFKAYLRSFRPLESQSGRYEKPPALEQTLQGSPCRCKGSGDDVVTRIGHWTSKAHCLLKFIMGLSSQLGPVSEITHITVYTTHHTMPSAARARTMSHMWSVESAAQVATINTQTHKL